VPAVRFLELYIDWKKLKTGSEELQGTILDIQQRVNMLTCMQFSQHVRMQLHVFQ